MSIPQLDSLLESCRRLDAEDVLIRTRGEFFAAQTSGKDVEEFLKPFVKLVSPPEENGNDLRAFMSMLRGASKLY